MSLPSEFTENAEPSGMRETQLPLTDAQREFARVLGDALADVWKSRSRSNAGTAPRAPETAANIRKRFRKKT